MVMTNLSRQRRTELSGLRIELGKSDRPIVALERVRLDGRTRAAAGSGSTAVEEINLLQRFRLRLRRRLRRRLKNRTLEQTGSLKQPHSIETTFTFGFKFRE